ncbi:MAG: hypothetical protein ACREQR_11305 [Candidatus Binataceae bacterium]
MSTWKSDIDLSCLLIAGNCQAVEFSLYGVTLIFLTGLKLQIYSSSEIKRPDGKIWRWEERHLIDIAGFGELLGYSISRYRIIPGDRLSIAFGNGYELEIRDDSEEFPETLIIRPPDGGPIIL